MLLVGECSRGVATTTAASRCLDDSVEPLRYGVGIKRRPSIETWMPAVPIHCADLARDRLSWLEVLGFEPLGGNVIGLTLRDVRFRVPRQQIVGGDHRAQLVQVVAQLVTVLVEHVR